MSAGYASRLSDYQNKGICGLTETIDTKRQYNLKLAQLSNLVSDAKNIVILTGAGISTSAGIPDFRGPKGIWTIEEKNKKRKRDENNHARSAQLSGAPADADFSTAKPTLTHRAITKLVSLNIVKYCITQNVDGLHRRSGLPRSKQSILHGCVFTEKCPTCEREYFRNFDVGGVGFKKTGRRCECGVELIDTVLDWEDELPDPDYPRAVEECESSDLCICLGTSLRIEPAGSLPTLSRRYVIVNLQETPYDKDAAIVIRAKVDDVMNDLLESLGYKHWDTEQDEKYRTTATSDPKVDVKLKSKRMKTETPPFQHWTQEDAEDEETVDFNSSCSL